MDVGDAFRRGSAVLEREVLRLGPADWDQETECQVSIRELLCHVITGNHFAVRLLDGVTAEEALAGPDRYAVDDVVAELRQSGTAQVRAFAGADTTRTLHHPSGDIDYDTFVRFRLGDVVIHGWDVARATARQPLLDDDVVLHLWRRVEPHVDEMRLMGSYGSSPPGGPGETASVEERLLHAFGRRRQVPFSADGTRQG